MKIFEHFRKGAPRLKSRNPIHEGRPSTAPRKKITLRIDTVYDVKIKGDVHFFCLRQKKKKTTLAIFLKEK